MSGKSSTFAVIDLNRSMRWPVDLGRKNDALTVALDKLIRRKCHLISITADRGRFQACIHFDSVHETITAVGEFARDSFHTSRLTLPARIGIATGEASDLLRPEEHPSLKRARWLAGLASSPAILVSDTTALLARDLELYPYGIEEYGEFFNMEYGQAATVYCILHPQIPDPVRGVDEVQQRHNIPDFVHFFYGRAVEIEDISKLLEKERFVSLVGASGVGKSALAKRIGHEVVEQYRDGVKYADISKAKNRHDILVQIFRSINLPIDRMPRIDIEMLRRHFGGRRHLIILDGCDGQEKVLAPVIRALLDTPHVRILTTSIRPLDIPGENAQLIYDLPVPPDDRPYTLNELALVDSCALLIEGIERFRQGFPPADEDAPLVVELVKALNGNPFAIGIAARSLRTRSLREVVDSYKNAKWGTLERNPAIEITLNSFPKSVRTALEYASMFVEPWTRIDLAEMMEQEPSSLTRELEMLVQSGLITEITNNKEQGVFVVNSLFRRELWNVLAVEDRLLDLRETHFFFVRNRLEHAIEELEGPNQRVHLDALERMDGDLEAMLRFVMESSDDPWDLDRALKQVWTYWYKRNRLLTAVSIADSALERYSDKDPAARARLLMLQAIFITKVGRSEEAIPLLETALSLIRRSKNPLLKYQILINLGIALWADGQPEASIDVYDRARAMIEHLDEVHQFVSIWTGLIPPLIDIGDLARVRATIEELEKYVALSEDRYDKWTLAIGKAEYWCEVGNTTEALTYIDLALTEALHINDRALIGRTFLWRSLIDARAGRAEDAAKALGVCLHYMNSGEFGLYKSNLKRISHLNTYLNANLSPAAIAELKLMGVIDHRTS